jgi:hypothetical protein
VIYLALRSKGDILLTRLALAQQVNWTSWQRRQGEGQRRDRFQGRKSRSKSHMRDYWVSRLVYVHNILLVFFLLPFNSSTPSHWQISKFESTSHRDCPVTQRRHVPASVLPFYNDLLMIMSPRESDLIFKNFRLTSLAVFFCTMKCTRFIRRHHPALKYYCKTCKLHAGSRRQNDLTYFVVHPIMISLLKTPDELCNSLIILCLSRQWYQSSSYKVGIFSCILWCKSRSLREITSP